MAHSRGGEEPKTMSKLPYRPPQSSTVLTIGVMVGVAVGEAVGVRVGLKSAANMAATEFVLCVDEP